MWLIGQRITGKRVQLSGRLAPSARRGMASLGGGAAKLGAGDNSDDIELALAATEARRLHNALAEPKLFA